MIDNIKIIAAIESKTLAIAADGEMPWNRPEDLKHFQEFTTGDAVLFGRKTYEGLPKKPLPGRHNIVLTRNQDYVKEVEPGSVAVCHSVETAFWAATGETTLWVAGGAEIYEQLLPYANEMHLTWIREQEHEDFGLAEKELTRFPELGMDLRCFAFETESREDHGSFEFEHLTRI